MLDILGFLSYAFVLLGLYLIGKKKRIGWGFKFVGDTLWVILGLSLGLYSIWLTELVFGFLDIKYFIQWKKDEEGINKNL